MHSTTAIIPQHYMHIITQVINCLGNNIHYNQLQYQYTISQIHNTSYLPLTKINVNVPSVMRHIDGLGIYVFVSDSVAVDALPHSDVLTRCQH